MLYLAVLEVLAVSRNCSRKSGFKSSLNRVHLKIHHVGNSTTPSKVPTNMPFCPNLCKTYFLPVLFIFLFGWPGAISPLSRLFLIKKRKQPRRYRHDRGGPCPPFRISAQNRPRTHSPADSSIKPSESDNFTLLPGAFAIILSSLP